MTQAINTLVSTALTAAHAYSDTIAKLRTQLKGHLSPDEVRTTLMPYVAGYYKVALVAKERGEGVRMDADAPKYEAAKKALQRMTADIVGKSANHKDELAVPADVLAAAAKLVKLCNEYEGAGRLIATAIAQAKAQ
jgi:hypothetical protein